MINAKCTLLCSRLNDNICLLLQDSAIKYHIGTIIAITLQFNSIIRAKNILHLFNAKSRLQYAVSLIENIYILYIHIYIYISISKNLYER